MLITGLEHNKELLINFGTKIREARIAKLITQKELSDKTGISLRTISSIENGSDTSFSNIICVLKALNLIPALFEIFPNNVQTINFPTKKPLRFKKSNKNNDWKWGDDK